MCSLADVRSYSLNNAAGNSKGLEEKLKAELRELEDERLCKVCSFSLGTVEKDVGQQNDSTHHIHCKSVCCSCAQKCFILQWPTLRKTVTFADIGVGAGKFGGAKDFLSKFPPTCPKQTPKNDLQKNDFISF